MKIETDQIGDVLVITPYESRIDASSAADFKSQLIERIGDAGHHIILDLSQVHFIDSSGLGVIVSLLKLTAGKGEISLCGIQDPVMSLFKMTRMDRIFKLYPSLAKALSATMPDD